MVLHGRKSHPLQARVCRQIWFLRPLTGPPLGNYAPDPTDTTGYNSDILGISFVTFDSTSGTNGNATPRIFVGGASNGTSNIFVSNDAGSTCKYTDSIYPPALTADCLVRQGLLWLVRTQRTFPTRAFCRQLKRCFTFLIQTEEALMTGLWVSGGGVASIMDVRLMRLIARICCKIQHHFGRLD